MLYLCRVRCHTKSGCEVLNTVGVMTQISDCDITGIVYILNCIVQSGSGFICQVCGVISRII